MKIIVVSGGFDPIHSGHIEYLKSAALKGEFLIVALNSDTWLKRKKNKYFMPFDERKVIIENLSMVDKVIDFEDDAIGSCIKGLEKIKSLYPNDHIIFCNGGDRDRDNIPEMSVEGIEFLFEIGGNNKKNSSSWILKEYQYDSETRIWGKFYNLFEDNKVKLKELILLPGKGISYQRHFYRNEIWFVSKGNCSIRYSENNPENYEEIKLGIEDVFHVKKGAWHQMINLSGKPCHIIEIQYGEKRIEGDIERLSFYENNEISRND